MVSIGANSASAETAVKQSPNGDVAKFSTARSRSDSTSSVSTVSSNADIFAAFGEHLVPSRPPTTPQSTVTLTYPFKYASSSNKRMDKGEGSRLEVKLAVDAGPGCGGIAWPAGEVLSQYLCWRVEQERDARHGSNPVRTENGHTSGLDRSFGYLRGRKVVELGSGTGLAGIVAGLLEPDSDVYITDIQDLLPLMERNVQLNFSSSSNGEATSASTSSGNATLRRPVKVAEYDWSADRIPPNLPQEPDIILAADCVYFEPAFPLLVDTLCKLAPIGAEREILFCWKKRRKADMRFFKMLKKHFESTPVEDDRPGEREKYEREGVRLMRLRRTK